MEQVLLIILTALPLQLRPGGSVLYASCRARLESGCGRCVLYYRSSQSDSIHYLLETEMHGADGSVLCTSLLRRHLGAKLRNSYSRKLCCLH